MSSKKDSDYQKKLSSKKASESQTLSEQDSQKKLPQKVPSKTESDNSRKLHQKTCITQVDDLLSEYASDPKKFKQIPGQLPVYDLERDASEEFQHLMETTNIKKENFFFDKPHPPKNFSTDFSSSKHFSLENIPEFLRTHKIDFFDNPPPSNINNNNVTNLSQTQHNNQEFVSPPPKPSFEFERRNSHLQEEKIREKEDFRSSNFYFQRRKSSSSEDLIGPLFSLPDPQIGGMEKRGLLAPKPQFILPDMGNIDIPTPSVNNDEEEILKQLENYRVTDSLSKSMRIPHLGVACISLTWTLAYILLGKYKLAFGLCPALCMEFFHWFYSNQNWSPATNSHLLTSVYVFALTWNGYFTDGYKSPLIPAYLVTPHFFTPATSDFHKFITIWTAIISAIFLLFYINDASIPPTELEKPIEHAFRIALLISTTVFWLFIGSTRSGVLREALNTSEMAQALAQKSNRMKSNFLANMSHELRTPLTGICGFADLLQHNEDLELGEIESLRLIQLSTNSVISTISGILDYSKLEEGSFNIEMVPFDICKTVEEALETCCYVLANNTNVELFGRLSKDLQNLKLKGDSTRIGQCLINLVSNALRFTDSGKVELILELGKKTDENIELIFKVVDTGLGICPEDQKRLFTAFQQGPSSIRKQGGTGLGLTITKSLVEKMKGNISLTSTSGKGTTFTFNIFLDLDLQAKKKPIQTTNFYKFNHIQSILLVGQHEYIHQAFLEFLKEYFPHVKVESFTKPLEDFYPHFNRNPIHVDLIITHSSNILRYFNSIIEISRICMKVPRLLIFTIIQSSMEPVLRESEAIILYLSPKPIVFSHILAENIAQICSKFSPESKLLLSRARRSSMDIPEENQMISKNSSSLINIKKISQTDSIHVLLVEDNIFNQRLFSQYLKRLNAKFTLASNGQEALEFLHTTEEKIDLILTDLWMPIIDGVGMTKNLREKPKYQNIPVIGITADTQFDFKGDCPFDKLLFKPIQLLTLKSAINEVLSNRQNK